MAISGKLARIKISGAPVAMTDEATTEIAPNDGTTFQITNAAHRIIAPTVAVTVEVDGVAAAASEYTLDRLAGKVVFAADQGAGVVTVTGSYLVTTSVAEAREYGYSLAANNVDASTWDDAGVDGWVRRKQVKLDLSGSISRFADVDHAFFDLISGGASDTPVVLEFYTDGGTTPDARASVVFDTDEISAASDGLVEEGLNFVGQPDTEGRAISFL